ncbi:hypothetical protein LguiA_021577 [Lonicera macranthoides]
MAPFAKRTTRSSTRTYSKKIHNQSKNEENLVVVSPTKGSNDNSSKVDDTNFDNSIRGCSTPKAKRFQIPEILMCPPAPMKKRKVVSNCLSRRTPIAFFAPPDLELFFFFALRDIETVRSSN